MIKQSGPGRRQIDQVLEQAPMLLFVLDAAGRLTFMEGQPDVMGIDPGELMGKLVFESLAHAPEVADRLRSALAGDQFSGVIRVAGSDRYVDLTCHPVRDSEGVQTGIAGLILDVTAWMQENEARREAEAKSLLIATMNHEARTPLNAILGFTELLGSGRQGELNERQLRYVANIESAGRKLLSLVTDVSDLSHLASGSLVIRPTNLAAADVIEEAALQVAPLAAAREVRLDTSCPPGLTVFADRSRLLQVIWNLASNAIRFTPTGGTVSLSARPEGDSTKIDVTDSGPGIPADRLSRIYLEFTEAAPPEEGSGLGLAMTRQLIVLMGGRVTVTSRLGIGTTFTITFPKRYSR
jgi:signal transduction histidine kinase